MIGRYGGGTWPGGTIRVENHLSLPRAALNILPALPDGNAHGHGANQSTEERTEAERACRPEHSTRSRRAWTATWLIEEVEIPEDCREATSRWRCCRVSELERQVLKPELQRLEETVRCAADRLGTARAKTRRA